MRVFVTGGTGYIGSAVCRVLAESGHRIVGLARSDESEEALKSAGHDVVRGDLRAPESLVEPAREADAVVHVAYVREQDAGVVDREAASALMGALDGTAKPFLYTSGCWLLGDTGDRPADEDRTPAPVELVRWRVEAEERAVDASGRDIRSVVVRPAVVYGEGGGIPGGLVEEAADAGVVRVVGDGLQEWPFVHVSDLADLYVRALGAEAGSLYNAAAGPSYQARDVAIAAGIAAGTDGAWSSWPVAEAREEMGGVADALALSQRMTSEKARRELGWAPEGPTLLEDLLRGSYRRTS